MVMVEIENKSFLRIHGKKSKVRKSRKRAVPPKEDLNSQTDRLNLVIPRELKNWSKDYAKRKNTTLTQIIIDHLVDLREKEKGIDVPQI